MVQAIDVERQTRLRAVMPAVGLGVLALLVGFSTAAFGPVIALPIFGALFFMVIVARPQYGIAMFLSTFLTAYPAILQGGGYLTVNNALGGVFLCLLTYKVYRERDWWFLRRREIQLLGFLLLIYYLANRFNGPDPRLLSLLGADLVVTDSLRLLANRTAFTLFFINYIRTPEHLRMIYILALILMVYTAVTGLQGALGGGGLKGYRAYTGEVVSGNVGLIRSAGNPNRLAMFAILGIAGLWYLLQSFRPGWLLLLIGVQACVILALAVITTASRSGLLGLGVCIAAIVWDEGPDIRKLFNVGLGALVLVMVAIQIVPQKALERITNLPFTQAGETGAGAASLERRAYTWTVGFDLFRENPILGIGMGNWALVRFINDPSHSAGSAHNSYLLALIEGGLLGLSGYLALLWCAWRNLRFAEPYVTRPGSPFAHIAWVLKGAKASLLVLIFFSMFADLWELVILFWLVSISIVLSRFVEQAMLEEALAA